MMASGSLSCPLCCQQNLGSVVALQEHLLYLMYRPLSCPVCQVMFSGLQALVQHLQQHLEINLNEEEAQQLPKLLVEGNNQKLTMQNSLPVFKNFGCREFDTLPENSSLVEIGAKKQLTVNAALKFISASKKPPVLLNSLSKPLLVATSPLPTSVTTTYTTPTFCRKHVRNEFYPSIRPRPSIVIPEVSISSVDGETASLVGAYLCSVCGDKLIGQAQYFAHMQSHSIGGEDKRDLQYDSQCRHSPTTETREVCNAGTSQCNIDNTTSVKKFVSPLRMLVAEPFITKGLCTLHLTSELPEVVTNSTVDCFENMSNDRSLHMKYDSNDAAKISLYKYLPKVSVDSCNHNFDVSNEQVINIKENEWSVAVVNEPSIEDPVYDNCVNRSLHSGEKQPNKSELSGHREESHNQLLKRTMRSALSNTDVNSNIQDDYFTAQCKNQSSPSETDRPFASRESKNKSIEICSSDVNCELTLDPCATVMSTRENRELTFDPCATVMSTKENCELTLDPCATVMSTKENSVLTLDPCATVMSTKENSVLTLEKNISSDEIQLGGYTIDNEESELLLKNSGNKIYLTESQVKQPILMKSRLESANSSPSHLTKMEFNTENCCFSQDLSKQNCDVNGNKAGYIHKKFHHERQSARAPQTDRLRSTISSEDRLYINNIQSVLVSRLNSSVSRFTELQPLVPRFYQDRSSTNKEVTVGEVLQSHQQDSPEMTTTTIPDLFICADGNNVEISTLKATPATELLDHTTCLNTELNETRSAMSTINSHSVSERLMLPTSSATNDVHSSNSSSPGDSSRYTCVVCKRVFLNLSNCRRHEREVHSPDRQLSCRECGKTLSSARQLANHMGIHRPRKSHRCHQCGHQCYTAAGIRTHKLEAHRETSSVPAVFKCLHCGLKFSRKFGLERHIQRKHSHKICCRVCLQFFSCTEHLTKHNCLSKSEKLTFGCLFCDSMFRSKFALRRHQSIHHNGLRESATAVINIASNGVTTEGTRKSQSCSGSTATVALAREKVADASDDACAAIAALNATNLQSKLHPPADNENASLSSSVTGMTHRGFQCSSCGRAFTRRDSLAVHLRTHGQPRRGQGAHHLRRLGPCAQHTKRATAPLATKPISKCPQTSRLQN